MAASPSPGKDAFDVLVDDQDFREPQSSVHSPQIVLEPQLLYKEPVLSGKDHALPTQHLLFGQGLAAHLLILGL